ncbi:catalase related subgroup [Microthyrium microscopicum]|uniref:Catalase related subgroup n=1 Tax=Microthyrium microscopicum TaxID=703497 RepID=A0A6A6UI33_9PEZI|nr:catalase related subgroup [Microthyrium microscopicum]
MPLPSDEKLVANATELLGLFKGAFGTPAGYRPAHAKGQLLSGTFTPSAEGKALSKAPHFQAPSTPVLVRFSDSTGIPKIPDTDGNSKPHGIAIRFNLPDENGKRKHTDIVAHSTPHFPVQTGEDFIAFLKALGGGTIGEFLGTHPAAARFVGAPKPFPVSFGTERYFGLNAFKLISPDGKETWTRYHILPTAGYQTIEDAEAEKKGENYLFDEVKERVKSGPIGFKIMAQIAEEGDVTDDITNEWPDSRKQVELGTFEIKDVVEDSESVQKNAIFDPIPRVEGIEPSADPILEFRAALYLISGRERRAA